ncbi:hypothetical protein HBI20_094400 [Parastagonospora nodorum]|nr:hypothetical protein HBI20_094400 [Parastagonospora nodorum]
MVYDEANGLMVASNHQLHTPKHVHNPRHLPHFKNHYPAQSPPRHGTTYIVPAPYLSHEIGHLSFVDVTTHKPSPSGLPPSAVVCPASDVGITEKLTENWIAEQGFGFVWTEPVRWLSKWWAEEF